MPRRPTTTKVVQAARRNIRKAQLSRIGTRESRSVGRITRSRTRYSHPSSSRTVRTRRSR